MVAHRIYDMLYRLPYKVHKLPYRYSIRNKRPRCHCKMTQAWDRYSAAWARVWISRSGYQRRDYFLPGFAASKQWWTWRHLAYQRTRISCPCGWSVQKARNR